MNLTEFINKLSELAGNPDTTKLEFVGIKWQEEHHPSAELFPIEFVDSKQTGQKTIQVKFITKPRNPIP